MLIETILSPAAMAAILAFAVLAGVALPYWAIIRMACHRGIGSSDRVLWVVVILLVPVAGALAYFIWEATRGRIIRRAERPAQDRPEPGDPEPEFESAVRTETESAATEPTGTAGPDSL